MRRGVTRNRRSASPGRGRAVSVVRGRLLARLGLVLGLAALTGIAYVWLMNETYQLGFAIEARRRELDNLERRNRQLELRILRLEAPQQIRERIRAFGLGLQLPGEGQIVLVREPMDDGIADGESRLARLQ